MVLCFPFPRPLLCLAYIIVGTQKTFGWVKGSIRFESIRLDSGFEGSLFDTEVAASEYFKWDTLVWGWEVICTVHRHKTWQIIKSNFMLHMRNRRDTQDNVICPRQQSKVRASWDPSVNSEKNSRSHSPLTCTHFYVASAELILPSPFYTAKETEAMKFKWFTQDYSIREGRDLTLS